MSALKGKEPKVRKSVALDVKVVERLTKRLKYGESFSQAVEDAIRESLRKKK